MRVRLDVAGEQGRHIGYQTQAGAAFQLEQRFARHRQIAFVGKLARHDAVEGGDDLRVARQRLRLGHGGFGNGVACLRGIEFGLGYGVLLAQIRQTIEVQLRLPERGIGLIELGLNLLRGKFHQHVALLDGLAERDRQVRDAAADLGFDRRLELGLHGADDFLQGRLLHGFDCLHADHGRRQGFAGRRLAIRASCRSRGERRRARRSQEHGSGKALVAG